MHTPHYVYSFIPPWNLCCFYLLVIMNTASMNMGLQDLASSSLGHTPKSGIAGSYGNMPGKISITSDIQMTTS